MYTFLMPIFLRYVSITSPSPRPSLCSPWLFPIATFYTHFFSDPRYMLNPINFVNFTALTTQEYTFKLLTTRYDSRHAPLKNESEELRQNSDTVVKLFFSVNVPFPTVHRFQLKKLPYFVTCIHISIHREPYSVCM
jgi:hypothetical protein